MIVNLVKLYGSPAVQDMDDLNSLNYLKDTFLVPVDKQFNGLTVTSGYRTRDQQIVLPIARRAKGTSQHEMAEAVDFVPNNESLWTVFGWMYRNVPWWQLIIYVTHGAANEIHVSRQSSYPAILRKVLVNRDGAWANYDPTETVTT